MLCEGRGGGGVAEWWHVTRDTWHVTRDGAMTRDILDRVNGGMKRSSSENATNATRDPETMFSCVVSGAGQGAGPGQGQDTPLSKPWKQRFSFRQPKKQATLEEVSEIVK